MNSTDILKIHNLLNEHCKNYKHYDFENITNITPEAKESLEHYISSDYECITTDYISCDKCVFCCENDNCLLTSLGMTDQIEKLIVDIIYETIKKSGKK